MRIRAVVFVLVTLGLLGLAVACGRSQRGAAPVSTLPSTPEASVAFAAIHDAWETRHPDKGAILEYLRRFPSDGAVPLVKVYLALVLIDAGDLSGADGVLATIADLRPTSTRDLATVARARSLRLHGAPQSALESLRPLVGKVIDDADREYFLEELALSAIAAHDDYEALAYLDAWLRGVGEDDRDRVRVKIGQILETLPRSVLEQTYRTMRASGAASGYGPETQKLVAARLARIAVDANDPALARWLLDVSGTSAAQAGGDAGLELGELATSRRGISIVSGKTIGLLLPTRSQELRDEAADVVRGVSWALDLPRPPGKTGGPRLVTRDDATDRAGTNAALDELAGEGATVILAGFDRQSADRASTWSEKNGIPVLLLASPSTSHVPKTTAAVIGERPEREIAMLAEALARHGARSAAFVADTVDDETSAKSAQDRAGLVFLPPVRCDVALAEAGKPRFPVESWFASGAEGILVSGPTSCSRDVLKDLRRVLGRGPTAGARKGPPAIALTLEASVLPSDAPKGLVVLSASAGIVPITASRPEDTQDEDVRTFMQRFGVRPSYWTALGRDGGVIARAAVAPLPDDVTSDPRGVSQRRAIVQNGILAARARLWTTDERGLGNDRVLPRALRLATWTP